MAMIFIVVLGNLATLEAVAYAIDYDRHALGLIRGRHRADY
jgi:hypothetical protein